MTLKVRYEKWYRICSGLLKVMLVQDPFIFVSSNLSLLIYGLRSCVPSIYLNYEKGALSFYFFRSRVRLVRAGEREVRKVFDLVCAIAVVINYLCIMHDGYELIKHYRTVNWFLLVGAGERMPIFMLQYAVFDGSVFWTVLADISKCYLAISLSLSH